MGSIGHTGFTGTSIWIDPASQDYAIILTNRVHPNGEGQRDRAAPPGQRGRRHAFAPPGPTPRRRRGRASADAAAAVLDGVRRRGAR